jgi:methionyl-tRNA synthetase
MYVFTKKKCIYPLSRIHNTSLIRAYFGLDSRECKCFEYLFNWILVADVCHRHYSDYQFYKAVDAVIHTLHLANLFFETHKPWELKKKVEYQKHLDVVLHITMETLRICGIILQPIIPSMTERLLDKLQTPKDCRSWQHCQTPSWSVEGAIYETKYIQSGKFVLFQRIYADKKTLEKKKIVN